LILVQYAAQYRIAWNKKGPCTWYDRKGASMDPGVCRGVLKRRELGVEQ
jgi:hypothetical protein